jgi:Fe-S-cluster containining protein
MFSRAEFFAMVRSNMSSTLTTEQLYGAYEAYLICPRSPYRIEKETAKIDCGRCGNCCRKPWRVEVDLHDVLRWIDEGRHDILASLEPRPWGGENEFDTDSVLIRQLATRFAGLDEESLATALAIASSVADSDGSYVLPKKEGCYYLVDGAVASCSIYDTRPEVCRRFPGVR